MRSLGTRRAVQVTGAATVAVLALTGCSAGQTAETSLLQTAISGINTATADGGLLIRNLQVTYNSPQGYSASGNAPIEVSLFNQTTGTITVTITSKAQQTAQPNVVVATQVGLVGTAPSGSASPSADASPSAGGSPSADASAPAAPQPATLTIPPLGTVAFLPGGSPSLQAIGLSSKLVSGGSLALEFVSSSTAQPLDVLAPVAVPLSPAPRDSGVPGENTEG